MNIYQYSDYRNLLKDFYTDQKNRNTSYSYKVFANKAKLGSPNYLKLVIEGARRITDKSLPNFIRGLKLAPREAEYFKALVQFQEASDPEARRNYEVELRQIRDRNTRLAKEIEAEKLEVVRSWRYLTILEMVLLDDFSDDPHWIAKRLRGKISPSQAKESLELLVRLGFLKIEDGKYRPSVSLITTSDEIYNKAVRDCQKQFIELGVESLLNDDLERREIGGLTLAVSKDSVQDIKKAIKEFRKEINRVYSRDKGNTDVYHLSINFFPLTCQGGN